MSRLLVVALLLGSVAQFAHAGRELKSFNPFCLACTTAVDVASSWLSDPTNVAELEEWVDDHVCSMSSDVDQCVKVTKGYIPVLVAYLRGQFTANKLCGAPGVCGNSLTTATQPAVKLPVQADYCPMCKYVMHNAQEYINQTDMSDQQLNATLYKACEGVPAELATQCFNFVEAYEPMIGLFLSEIKDGDTLCKLSGACIEDLMQLQLPPVPLSLMMTFNSVYMSSMELFNSMNLEDEGNTDLDDVNLSICDNCKNAVTNWHKAATNPTTRESVTNYAKLFCNLVPFYADRCKELATARVTIMFDFMAKHLEDPATFCMHAAMCPRTVSADGDSEDAQMPQFMQMMMAASAASSRRK